MHTIAKNGIITLTAGDSLIVPLYITYTDANNSERSYKLKAEDTIYLSITTPGSSFEEGLIRKIYTIADVDSQGDILINISSAETENLAPGVYYYEIKFLTRRNNIDFVDTIVKKTKLFII